MLFFGLDFLLLTEGGTLRDLAINLTIIIRGSRLLIHRGGGADTVPNLLDFPYIRHCSGVENVIVEGFKFRGLKLLVRRQSPASYLSGSCFEI